MSDWKNELRELIDATEGQLRIRPEGPRRVRGFISDVVVPAFEELAEELQDHGRDVEVEYGDRSASIRVAKDGKDEFVYHVRIRAYRKARFAFPVVPLKDAEGQTYRAEIHLKDGPIHQDVTDATKQDMIRYFLHDYGRHLKWHL